MFWLKKITKDLARRAVNRLSGATGDGVRVIQTQSMIRIEPVDTDEISLGGVPFIRDGKLICYAIWHDSGGLPYHTFASVDVPDAFELFLVLRAGVYGEQLTWENSANWTFPEIVRHNIKGWDEATDEDFNGGFVPMYRNLTSATESAPGFGPVVSDPVLTPPGRPQTITLLRCFRETDGPLCYESYCSSSPVFVDWLAWF